MAHAAASCWVYSNQACALADNTAPMEVEAFVVNVRNAVHADDEGILNPLIKRQQAGLVAQRVFSSPAVKVMSGAGHTAVHHTWCLPRDCKG